MPMQSFTDSRSSEADSLASLRANEGCQGRPICCDLNQEGRALRTLARRALDVQVDGSSGSALVSDTSVTSVSGLKASSRSMLCSPNPPVAGGARSVPDAEKQC